MKNLIAPIRLFLGFFIPLIFTSIIMITLAFIWSIFYDISILPITKHPAFFIMWMILMVIQTVWMMMWIFDEENKI